MPKFNVEVTETLARILTVEAPTADEAEEKIRAMYEKEEIVLEAEDMVGEEDIHVWDDLAPDDFPVDVTVTK